MSINLDRDRLTFWFEHKPRNTFGAKKAVDRWVERQQELGRPITISPRGKIRDIHSIHHINLFREQGNVHNLFVCESQKQHDNLHSQLQAMTGYMIKSGLVNFSFDDKKYFIDNPYLLKWFGDWLKAGSPDRQKDKYYARPNPSIIPMAQYANGQTDIRSFQKEINNGEL